MSLLYLKHNTVVCFVRSPRSSIIHQGSIVVFSAVSVNILESKGDSSANIIKFISPCPS